MIKGTAKTEAQYRAVVMDSSSSLKDFSTDRKKYYKKYFLGEKVEDKDSSAANMGRIVETLLMEPHLFDEKFYMSSCISTPTGLMLDFVEALYRVTRDATDEKGKITRNFADISLEAYDKSGFKIKYEAVIGKFQGSDAEIYYNEIREVRSKGLTVVSSQDIANSEKIVNGLKTNFATSEIINLINSSRWEIYNQFPIEDYKIDGLEFKSLLDKIVIDHDKQTIQVYDLKCTWSVENFLEEYYLYRRAYIQAYLYWQAAISLTLDKESSLYEYSVPFPMFIVCDSINYYNPLIYTLSTEDMNDAYEGFTYKNRNYPGVKTIIENLKWAKENDIWNISKENYLNKGFLNIKTING
jgi:hypothetical protein